MMEGKKLRKVGIHFMIKKKRKKKRDLGLTSLFFILQVEKNLMLTIHKHLPHFLPQLDSSSAALCLPLLAHNIGLFIDDTDVCKSLINRYHLDLS